MKKIIQHIIHHRWPYFIGVIVLLFAAIPFVIMNPPRINASFESVGFAQKASLENYQKIREIFPLENRVFIEITPNESSFDLVLNDLDSIQNYLLNTFPGSKIKSIKGISSAVFRGTDLEDISVNDALIELGEIPAVGNLISRDQQSFLLIFIPKDQEYSELIPKVNQLSEMGFQTVNNFRFTGQAHIESAVAEAIAGDLVLLSLLIAVLFVGILFLTYRSVKGIVYCLIIIVLSLIPIVVILSTWNKDLNLITVLCIPVVLVLSVADSVHLLTGITSAHKDNLGWEEKVSKSMNLYIIPSALTSLTTAFAFFSLSLSSTQSISDFGIITGLVVLVAFLVTYLSSPALLLYLKPQTRFTDGIFRLFELIQGHKKKIAYGLFAFLIIGLILTPRLSFHNEFEVFLPQNTKAQEDHDLIRDNYYSQATLEILLGPLDNSLNRDSLLSSFTNTMKEWDNVMYANSSADRIKVGNVPLFKVNIMNNRSLREEYQSKNGNWERIELLVSQPDKIMDMEADVKQLLDVSGVPYRYSSPVIMTHEMNRELASDLIKSLGFSWLIIFLAFLIMTRSITKTLIGNLVNIIPLGFTVILFIVFDFDLNIVTALTLVVCMGIMVDDTLHAFYRYVNLDKSMEELGFGMLTTTMILCFGLGAFAFSNFRPTEIFGIVSSATLLITILSDLAVLPLLLKQGK